MFKAQEILGKRYQLERQLGRTARGHETWLAQDLTTQEVVVVKLLAFSPQMRWEELKLFEREAKVLKSLNHPLLPRYRDYFDLDQQEGGGIPWFGLVQDYIPGFSLQELLEQGKHFTEAEIRSITAQVLEILIYLHSLIPQVLHRDIKPSNLIFGDDGAIHLIDFGAVQAQAGVTGVTFTVVGTSGYAPLEQFWGKAVPASDIYALGATIIHLLTGISPANLPQKNSQIQFRERVTVKPDLIAWIEKATHPSLESRFMSADTALLALKNNSIYQEQTGKLLILNHGIKRPFYTRIKVNQSPDKLEILIPAGSYRRLLKVINPLFWDLEIKLLRRLYHDLVDVSPLSMIIISLSLIILALLIGLPFLIFVVLGIKLLILYTQSIEVYIDRQTLELVRHSLGLLYGGKRVNLEDIVTVSQRKRDSLCEVLIDTKNDDFLIGHALREDECEWLTQIIKNWLDSVKE